MVPYAPQLFSRSFLSYGTQHFLQTNCNQVLELGFQRLHQMCQHRLDVQRGRSTQGTTTTVANRVGILHMRISRSRRWRGEVMSLRWFTQPRHGCYVSPTLCLLGGRMDSWSWRDGLKVTMPLPMSWVSTMNASERILAGADLVITGEATVASSLSPFLKCDAPL